MFPNSAAWPFRGLFACLFVIFVGACSRQESMPDPIRAVKLIEVGLQERNAVVEYAGDVRAKTESKLGFQGGGKVTQRLVGVGDVVKKGQVLAEIDAQDYVLAAQAAQARVAAAQTQRDLAQADWRRFSALKEKGFISGVELDRRHASLQAAQAQLQQAQAQAAAQSNQSRYTRLMADASGVVTAVQAEPGQVVAAGVPVVQLAHDGARDVFMTLPEGAYGEVSVGQSAQVRMWSNNELLDGVVREVAASADPVTRTYLVKVQVRGAKQPALGATAYVRIQKPGGRESRVLKLPSTAVSELNGDSVIWEFDPASSTVRTRKVEIAGVEGNDILIADGVHEGMQLVSAGTHVLTQGQKVSVYQPRHPEVAH